MADSIVPDVVAALVAACKAAGALSGVTVLNGVEVASGSEAEKLFIARGAAAGAPGVEAEDVAVELPQWVDAERFAVVCAADVWSGDVDPVARRARAYAIRNAVRGLLFPAAGDVTLGVPRLAWARVGRSALFESQVNEGVRALVEFRVECQTRVTAG